MKKKLLTAGTVLAILFYGIAKLGNTGSYAFAGEHILMLTTIALLGYQAGRAN